MRDRKYAVCDIIPVAPAAVAAMAALLAEMEPIVAAAQEAATAEDSGYCSPSISAPTHTPHTVFFAALPSLSEAECASPHLV